MAKQQQAHTIGGSFLLPVMKEVVKTMIVETE